MLPVTPMTLGLPCRSLTNISRSTAEDNNIIIREDNRTSLILTGVSRFKALYPCTLDDSPIKLLERIELPSKVYKTLILPLNYRCININFFYIEKTKESSRLGFKPRFFEKKSNVLID